MLGVSVRVGVVHTNFILQLLGNGSVVGGVYVLLVELVLQVMS